MGQGKEPGYVYGFGCEKRNVGGSSVSKPTIATRSHCHLVSSLIASVARGDTEPAMSREKALNANVVFCLEHLNLYPDTIQNVPLTSL